MPVKKDLLEMMACPKCKWDIREECSFLTCSKCKLAYPVLDGDVPDMLIEDAWHVEKAKAVGFRHKIEL